MRTTCKISESVEVRSEEQGTVSIIIGTVGRVVNAKHLTCAVQNAKNVGFEPSEDLKIENTLVEVSDATRYLVISNSATDVQKVTITIDELSQEVLGDELLKAVQMCGT